MLGVLCHKWFVPACFAAYIAARGLVILIPYAPSNDPLWYLTQAAHLAQGQGYALDSGPTAYFPIGWSAFLAIFFKPLGATLGLAQLVDLALAAATFFVVLAIARRIFCEPVARLSVLLLAAYPNNIAYVAIPSTEIFFTFLLLLAWLMWIRSPRLAMAAGCGVVLGIATLTRTQAVLLPSLFFVSDLLLASSRRNALSRFLVVNVVIAITVSPWLWRNYAVFGEFPVLATNGGMNLLLGNNAFAHGSYADADGTLLSSVDFSDANEAQADRLAARLALDWVTSHPEDSLRLLPAKAFRLWGPDGEAVWMYETGYKRFDEYRTLFQEARLFNQAYYLAIVTGFVIAPFVWRHRLGAYFPPGTQFAYLLACYTTLTSLVVFGEPRFHFPVMPFAIMCAASVLVLLPSRTDRRWPDIAAQATSA